MRLAAEVHVLDDVEVVAEREILVDDLDPELGGVLRAVDRDRLAVEEDLAAVGRVDAGDALDQRRLAGTVVADERHHLAGAHLEVDVGERLHGAEVLRDPAELEQRRSVAGAGGAVAVAMRSWAPEGRRGGRPRGGRPPVQGLLAYAGLTQYFAYSPLQTSLFFR